MNHATVQLTKYQAQDIASLAHAAGKADQPEDLQDLIITFTEKDVRFETSNRYVAASRRGTIGEFSDLVTGTGVFSMNAKKLAKLLRLAVNENNGEGHLDLAFGHEEYLEINGINVGLIRLETDQKSKLIGDIIDDAWLSWVDKPYSDDHLPAFNMEQLTAVSKAAGGARQLQMFGLAYRRWGFVAPPSTSWRYTGVIMETNL